MSEPEHMPPTSVELQALGHFVRVMERRFPGVCDEWVDGLQDEALLNEIVRLRGPREQPQVLEARTTALAWAKHVRLVTLAYLGRATQLMRASPHPRRSPQGRLPQD